MKKLYITILLLLVLPALSGCTGSSVSFKPNTESEYSAVYTKGEFSFSCKISITDTEVTVEPTSTAAKGMRFNCNADTVTVSKGNMTKSYPKAEQTAVNPAVIMYEVFSGLPEPVKTSDGLYEYKGIVSAGAYTLTANPDSTLNTLTLSDAGITVIFDVI